MRNSIATGICISLVLACALFAGSPARGEAFSSKNIPLPEHPRPDFLRAKWVNLNGPWEFRFDEKDAGRKRQWFKADVAFHESIMVPFPWGSKLSGVEDKADIGWYRRSITVPESLLGGRIFLVVGASDWRTTAWLDGNLLGNTPKKRVEIPSGSHTVLLKCGPCAEPQEKTLTFSVKAGETYTSVRNEFQP